MNIREGGYDRRLANTLRYGRHAICRSQAVTDLCDVSVACLK